MGAEAEVVVVVEEEEKKKHQILVLLEAQALCVASAPLVASLMSSSLEPGFGDASFRACCL